MIGLQVRNGIRHSGPGGGGTDWICFGKRGDSIHRRVKYTVGQSTVIEGDICEGRLGIAGKTSKRYPGFPGGPLVRKHGQLLLLCRSCQHICLGLSDGDGSGYEVASRPRRRAMGTQVGWRCRIFDPDRIVEKGKIGIEVVSRKQGCEERLNVCYCAHVAEVDSIPDRHAGGSSERHIGRSDIITGWNRLVVVNDAPIDRSTGWLGIDQCCRRGAVHEHERLPDISAARLQGLRISSPLEQKRRDVCFSRVEVNKSRDCRRRRETY
jgi:hypothetical protein